MNSYVTGNLITKLRKNKNMTQNELAQILCVSDKTISKWETGKGYPDISLLEPLSKALGISLVELLAGETIENTNKHANMKQTKFYVCPICGNIIFSVGKSMHSCCGITLPALDIEEMDKTHAIQIQRIEDEYIVSLNHPMNKEHYISFIAVQRYNGIELLKLYPEQEASVHFKIEGVQQILVYCTHHGLFALNSRKKDISSIK